ncbi:GGDEF domain-containing protein [Hydrogenophaga aquatica]
MTRAQPLFGIRARLWVAAALPAILAVAMLLTGFLDRYNTELTGALRDRARASAAQLGGAAEFALFAGNQEGLQRLADAALAGDAQMRGVGIFSADGGLQVLAGSLSPGLPALGAEEFVSTEGHLVVVSPVRLVTVTGDDLFEAEAAPRGMRQGSRVVGHVVVELTMGVLEKQKSDLLLWAVAITGLGLLLAGVLSTLIASSVTGPIANISHVVARIGEGELGARADVQRSGALATLASGINAMAAQVAMTQEHLRQQVNLATDELRKQKEAAELAARIDPLTGVASRRAFTEIAETEIQRALRYRLPLAMVMVDIDHFKTVNDTYGHMTGDAVLAAFARAISQEVREVDVVGRLGGEEFVVLLPNISGLEAVQVAERMRLSVATSEMLVNGEQLRYTASFGVAEFDPKELSLSSFLSRADDALYRAKRNGRNRVELAA